MNIYETLLLFALVCALAAFFVMWAKWEEERDRRWDEISRAVGLENAISFWKDANEDKAKDILYYHKECKRLKNALEIEMERTSRLDKDCAQLEQSLRSALLCPHNDHVWKGGFCVKCGRRQDATD